MAGALPHRVIFIPRRRAIPQPRPYPPQHSHRWACQTVRSLAHRARPPLTDRPPGPASPPSSRRPVSGSTISSPYRKSKFTYQSSTRGASATHDAARPTHGHHPRPNTAIGGRARPLGRSPAAPYRKSKTHIPHSHQCLFRIPLFRIPLHHTSANRINSFRNKLPLPKKAKYHTEATTIGAQKLRWRAENHSAPLARNVRFQDGLKKASSPLSPSRTPCAPAAGTLLCSEL